VQWQSKATYLYGIVEPATGDHFSMSSPTSTALVSMCS
jgi:hypothetical protein